MIITIEEARKMRCPIITEPGKEVKCSGNECMAWTVWDTDLRTGYCGYIHTYVDDGEVMH